MGVILTTAIVFALAAAVMELRLATKIPFIRRLVERFSVVGIGFSILLSLLLGTLFGAAGLIVMFAAVMATMITQPIYMLMSKNKDTSSKFGENYQEFKATYRPVGKFIKALFLVLLAPIWLPVKIRRWWLSHTTTPSDYTTAA